jgi:hypothetical protein
LREHALATKLGPATLAGFHVVTGEIVAFPATRALRR